MRKMGLGEINTIIKNRDIYLKIENNESKEPIVEDFYESPYIHGCYEKDINEIDLNDETKYLLEIIFRQFGSYSINDLAPLLDSFKSF